MSNYLMISPNLAIGGAEMVTYSLANRIVKSGNHVTILLFKNEGILRSKLDKKIDILYINKEREKLSYFRIIVKLFKISQHFQFDSVIGTQEGLCIVLAAIIGAMCHCRTIGWVHTDLGLGWRTQPMIVRLLMGMCIMKMDVIAVPSIGVKDSIINRFHKVSKCFVTSNWIIPRDDNASNKEIINLIKSKNKSFKIISIARLVPEKEHAILLDSLKKIDIYGCNYHCFLFGDGPLMNALKKKASQLNLSENITFFGEILVNYDIIKEMDLLVLTSSREGFGMVLIEAMAAGVPVLSTDCPSGPREILDGGKYGILVPVGDSEKISNEIINIASDNNLRILLSDAGKQRAELYSLETIYLNFWEKILGGIGSPLN
jgi:glycosyltransferase involved in cell wall biosynthesis